MSAAVEVAELGFDSDRERCAAWLHLPAGAGPHPCVVLLHSTAGLRQMRCYAGRADAFAAAGVAALQFDCRHFGASAGEPRQLLDLRRQAEDLDAAIAFARERHELDAGRLALWGGSASCGTVLAASLGAEAVRAVICLTPFVPGRATQRSAHTPLARLAVATLADRLRLGLGREPRGVRVGGQPGEAAILVREEALERERSMLPEGARLDRCGERAELADGTVWENRVVLRPRLRSPNPRRLAARVGVPLLVLAGERDSLCPLGPAAELARRAPRGELRALPHGHFDLYDGASLPHETEFLRRHLLKAPD